VAPSQAGKRGWRIAAEAAAYPSPAVTHFSTIRPTARPRSGRPERARPICRLYFPTSGLSGQNCNVLRKYFWQTSGMPSTTRLMRTWTGASDFKYSGSERAGLQIYCGEGLSRGYAMTATELREALASSGREVKIGTHRTAPPNGSIGDWIRLKFRKGGIMSYVRPILIEEAYAVRGGETDRIQIKPFSSRDTPAPRTSS
jgi:hypothetical protein